MNILKKFKKDTDDWDAERARKEYKKEKFVQYFSYRKGNKTIPLKSVSRIARQFRNLKRTPRFWDYAEEKDEAEEQEIE